MAVSTSTQPRCPPSEPAGRSTESSPYAGYLRVPVARPRLHFFHRRLPELVVDLGQRHVDHQRANVEFAIVRLCLGRRHHPPLAARLQSTVLSVKRQADLDPRSKPFPANFRQSWATAKTTRLRKAENWRLVPDKGLDEATPTHSDTGSSIPGMRQLTRRITRHRAVLGRWVRLAPAESAFLARHPARHALIAAIAAVVSDG